MIPALPDHISITFILTSFLTVGFLIYAIRQSVLQTTPAKILLASIAFYLFFTAVLGLGGFYTNTQTLPPRVFLFGALPALILILVFFIFFRRSFVEKLPLKTLTLLSFVRIPVEIVILWLFQNGQMPQIMTLEGRNFDILAGISAPIIFWIAFRQGKIKRGLLIGWNMICVLLLANIVTLAILALPSPIQQIAFDQPNRAVMFFPFIWLPAIVVPIVLFSHLASLWQLVFSKTESN